MHVDLECLHSEAGSTQLPASAIRRCDISYTMTEGKQGTDTELPGRQPLCPNPHPDVPPAEAEPSAANQQCQ